MIYDNDFKKNSQFIKFIYEHDYIQDDIRSVMNLYEIFLKYLRSSVSID